MLAATLNFTTLPSNTHQMHIILCLFLWYNDFKKYFLFKIFLFLILAYQNYQEMLKKYQFNIFLN